VLCGPRVDMTALCQAILRSRDSGRADVRDRAIHCAALPIGSLLSCTRSVSKQDCLPADALCMLEVSGFESRVNARGAYRPVKFGRHIAEMFTRCDLWQPHINAEFSILVMVQAFREK
jgi:hypothetical protein